MFGRESSLRWYTCIFKFDAQKTYNVILPKLMNHGGSCYGIQLHSVDFSGNLYKVNIPRFHGSQMVGRDEWSHQKTASFFTTFLLGVEIIPQHNDETMPCTSLKVIQNESLWSLCWAHDFGWCFMLVIPWTILTTPWGVWWFWKNHVQWQSTKSEWPLEEWSSIKHQSYLVLLADVDFKW